MQRLLMIALAAFAFAGCPWRIEEPSGCTPRTFACRDGRPHVCSPQQRWTPADRPCAELVGTVCCGLRSSARGARQLVACVPLAACETPPVADAGAPVDYVERGRPGDGGAL